MHRIIIESLDGFQTARQEYSEKTVVWRTTSPGLIEELYEDVNISSLEEDVKPADMDLIGLAAYDFAIQTTKYLNDQCIWRQYVNFDHHIGASLFRLFNVLFYKGWLLR